MKTLFPSKHASIRETVHKKTYQPFNFIAICQNFLISCEPHYSRKAIKSPSNARLRIKSYQTFNSTNDIVNLIVSH
jgi:hypothetical protein